MIYQLPIEKAEKYSTQVNIDGDLKKEILDFGKNLKDIIEREKEPHITVLYGIEKLADKKNIDGGYISGKLGLIKKFELEDRDVIYIEVFSDEINAKNEEFSSKVDYSNDYEKYVPHVTLAYVKKNTNNSIIGNERFLDRLFTNLPVLFCYKNEKKVKLSV